LGQAVEVAKDKTLPVHQIELLLAVVEEAELLFMAIT